MGNLIALREITLRRTADRLDDQMRAYMATRAIPGPWPARERLLVCVSPSPLGERLVRAARRLADDLGAAWFAVYVETPGQGRLSPEERDQVARTLALAEELGAKAFVVPGSSVADAVLTYARAHNVTKIIAGKPLRPRWRELLRRSVVDQLIRQGAFDVHVVNSGPEQAPARCTAQPGQEPVSWTRYGSALVGGGRYPSQRSAPFDAAPRQPADDLPLCRDHCRPGSGAWAGDCRLGPGRAGVRLFSRSAALHAGRRRHRIPVDLPRPCSSSVC